MEVPHRVFGHAQKPYVPPKTRRNITKIMCVRSFNLSAEEMQKGKRRRDKRIIAETLAGSTEEPEQQSDEEIEEEGDTVTVSEEDLRKDEEEIKAAEEMVQFIKDRLAQYKVQKRQLLALLKVVAKQEAEKKKQAAEAAKKVQEEETSSARESSSPSLNLSSVDRSSTKPPPLPSPLASNAISPFGSMIPKKAPPTIPSTVPAPIAAPPPLTAPSPLYPARQFPPPKYPPLHPASQSHSGIPSSISSASPLTPGDADKPPYPGSSVGADLALHSAMASSASHAMPVSQALPPMPPKRALPAPHAPPHAPHPVSQPHSHTHPGHRGPLPPPPPAARGHTGPYPPPPPPSQHGAHAPPGTHYRHWEGPSRDGRMDREWPRDRDGERDRDREGDRDRDGKGYGPYPGAPPSSHWSASVSGAIPPREVPLAHSDGQPVTGAWKKPLLGHSAAHSSSDSAPIPANPTSAPSTVGSIASSSGPTSTVPIHGHGSDRLATPSIPPLRSSSSGGSAPVSDSAGHAPSSSTASGVSVPPSGRPHSPYRPSHHAPPHALSTAASSGPAPSSSSAPPVKHPWPDSRRDPNRSYGPPPPSSTSSEPRHARPYEGYRPSGNMPDSIPAGVSAAPASGASEPPVGYPRRHSESGPGGGASYYDSGAMKRRPGPGPGPHGGFGASYSGGMAGPPPPPYASHGHPGPSGPPGGPPGAPKLRDGRDYGSESGPPSRSLYYGGAGVAEGSSSEGGRPAAGYRGDLHAPNPPRAAHDGPSSYSREDSYRPPPNYRPGLDPHRHPHRTRGKPHGRGSW